LFSTQKKGVDQAAVRAVVARAWYTLPQATLRVFVARLYDGMFAGPQDSAILRLRDYLLSVRSGSPAIAVDTYARTERALRAYEDGQPLTRLFASDKELFPLPDEMNQR
jgi:hypothetical protein